MEKLGNQDFEQGRIAFDRLAASGLRLNAKSAKFRHVHLYPPGKKLYAIFYRPDERDSNPVLRLREPDDDDLRSGEFHKALHVAIESSISKLVKQESGERGWSYFNVVSWDAFVKGVLSVQPESHASGVTASTHCYVTRLSYNSSGWVRPTGEAAKAEADNTYNSVTGFGHEDWLFRNDWVIDGWRYAFLQGVNKSHARLVKEQAPFDVVLFTVSSDKRRTYVAQIVEVECLSEQQADEAYGAFKRLGWADAMAEDVRAVEGDVSALGHPQWARHVLNIRFRLENVCRVNIDVAPGDQVMHLHRYQLYDAESVAAGEWVSPMRRRGRRGGSELPDAASYVRGPIAAKVCTPEHVRMQRLLVEQLRSERPSAIVVFEQDNIDVLLREGDMEELYEIKTDLSPRTVLRLAIGQLLEYGHHSGRRDSRSLSFFAVGRCQLTPEDAVYLNTLRHRYDMPIDYRVVNLP